MNRSAERARSADWDRLSPWLIRQAAERAPTCWSSRLHEEWLAGLAERRSAASRLRLAFGCWWAAIAIDREHRLVLASPAANFPVSASRLSAGAERCVAEMSLRFGTVFLILGVHAAVFCGLGPTLARPGAGGGYFAAKPYPQPPASTAGTPAQTAGVRLTAARAPGL